MTRGLLALAALAFATSASAETIAIVDARLMTMTAKGEIERGTIVIRDGRIAAIGPDIAVPAGARVMDGRGGTVTPGLIQADSTLGRSAERRVGDEGVSTGGSRGGAVHE